MAATRMVPILAAMLSALAFGLAGVAFSAEPASQPLQLARLEKASRPAKKAPKNK